MSYLFSHDINVVINAFIARAIECRASDIHIESTGAAVRIRFRIDGLLYDQAPLDFVDPLQIIACIKVRAHIDVSQTRLAQDGKFQFSDNQEIDLRVATFPAVHGEKMVIRLLYQKDTLVALDNLGMTTAVLSAFRTIMTKQSGFILVSGPTGSGKTTTLYAALTELNTTEKHIITLEDPVEYYLAGVTQGQVHASIGFDFADGMRALLRQDPDIVLIGEMRDAITARTAVQASLTGHMVLSTVHTGDAPSVLIRLIDMGVEPFLINASITAVIAQRLVRLLCVSCKYEKEPDEHERALLESMQGAIEKVYDASGCAHCFGLGYKGRTGIFELLMMTDAIRSLVIERAHTQAIRTQAIVEGMHTLCDDGLQKVRQGIITVQELYRVLH